MPTLVSCGVEDTNNSFVIETPVRKPLRGYRFTGSETQLREELEAAMSVAKQNVPARDDLAGPGWVLDVLSFFSRIAICPGL
jgi:hypothetical protein